MIYVDDGALAVATATGFCTGAVRSVKPGSGTRQGSGISPQCLHEAFGVVSEAMSTGEM